MENGLQLEQGAVSFLFIFVTMGLLFPLLLAADDENDTMGEGGNYEHLMYERVLTDKPCSLVFHLLRLLRQKMTLS